MLTAVLYASLPFLHHPHDDDADDNYHHHAHHNNLELHDDEDHDDHLQRSRTAVPPAHPLVTTHLPRPKNSKDADDDDQQCRF